MGEVGGGGHAGAAAARRCVASAASLVEQPCGRPPLLGGRAAGDRQVRAMMLRVSLAPAAEPETDKARPVTTSVIDIGSGMGVVRRECILDNRGNRQAA